MTLEPLLSASPAIQLHAFAAMTAFVLGVVRSLDARATGRTGTFLHARRRSGATAGL